MQKPWEVDILVYSSEADLVAGLRNKEKLACTCLLKNYAPRLYRLALQMMAHTDEAEDVLQESMITVCNKIHTFEGRSSLGSWLHRIVVNTALMRLRKSKKKLVSLEEESIPDLSVSAPAEIPALQALTLELREHIDMAIMQLPVGLRTAFVLRDVEGLSTQEAAQALTISESALKVRLHRARAHVRTALEPYLDS